MTWQIIDLAAKATAAGQLKDGNPEAGIKAAKALIERVRRPDPDAIAGPLLET